MQNFKLLICVAKFITEAVLILSFATYDAWKEIP